MADFKNVVTLSLGGSIVIPDQGVVDHEFLKQFNAFIRKHVDRGTRFFIVVGGGATTRLYQNAAKEARPSVTADDLDWVGIHTTRANAQLIRIIFKDIARPRVFDKYDEQEDIGDYPVIIGAGWKPGWSTDYCTVSLGKFYGAKHIFNMSNIKKVYDKDPRKHEDAEPIDTMSWKDYREMVGDTWTPGLNTPFDPIAAKLASELDVAVTVLNGRDLDNLEQAIEGKEYIGTTIK